MNINTADGADPLPVAQPFEPIPAERVKRARWVEHDGNIHLLVAYPDGQVLAKLFGSFLCGTYTFPGNGREYFPLDKAKENVKRFLRGELQ